MAIAMMLRLYTSRYSTPLLAIMCFFFLGSIRGSSVDILDESHFATSVEDQQHIVLVGTLAEKVSVFRDTSRATVDVEFIKADKDRDFIKRTGKILLSVDGLWPASIFPGNSIIVRAKAEIPAQPAAPGVFDYRQYLADKKIYLTARVDSPIMVQPVDALSRSWTKSIIYGIERQRTLISGYLDENLNARWASLYKALLIGDRSSIEPEVLETLKRSGILHLWAISGMHLGMVTVITYSLLYWVLRRSDWLILKFNVKKAALFLTIPPLIIYSLLAGFQPPAARALIMYSCMVIALGCDRLHSPLTTLSGAALTILLIDPRAIESPSFQLSFSAVASIVMISPKLLSLVPCPRINGLNLAYKARNLLLSIVVITVTATLGTLPLLLFHFNRLSLVTLPSNLLVQPLICFFSLPLGIVSLPFILFNQSVAALLLDTGARVLEVAHDIAKLLSNPEYSQLWVASPPLLLILIYYLLLFSVPYLKFSSLRSTLILICSTLVTFQLLFPFDTPIRFRQQNERVTILDVGHGSANLIELKEGRVVLIDGGSRSAPGYDCGARIIAPYLWHNRISKVHDIVITHEDADHFNGIPTVIKRFKPERLWLPHLEQSKQGFTRLIGLAREYDLDIIVPAPGVIIEESGGQISVIGPASSDILSSEDDRGLVLRLEFGEISVLFPGDISKKREIELIRDGAHLASTILLSPHHGSATSSSLAMLSAVSPELLVFSSGDSQIGRFPANETLDNAEKLGIRTINTSEEGTIVIALDDDNHDNGGYQLITQQQYKRRYWERG